MIWDSNRVKEKDQIKKNNLSLNVVVKDCSADLTTLF